jgi:hypothetical protein
LALPERRASAQEQTVKVGIARSTSNAAELMALKHGYFKEPASSSNGTTSTPPRT